MAKRIREELAEKLLTLKEKKTLKFPLGGEQKVSHRVVVERKRFDPDTKQELPPRTFEYDKEDLLERKAILEEELDNIEALLELFQ